VLSERDLELADEIFESTAKQMLDKKTSLFNKYRYLLFKESMVSIVLILYYMLIFRTRNYMHYYFLLLLIDDFISKNYYISTIAYRKKNRFRNRWNLDRKQLMHYIPLGNTCICVPKQNHENIQIKEIWNMCCILLGYK